MKAGWIKTKLKDVCELVNGRAYKKDELLAEGKYRVLRVGNFFTNDHWYFSDLELEDKKYCDKGDLLYAWSASFGPRVWVGEKVIFHYHIWKVLPNPSLIDQKFLFHFLMWDMDKIKEDQGAGTTMLHVSKGSMDERDIFVPPIKEQQRIVAILDQAFEGIAKARANAEQNLQNARALFESHLQSVFTQRGEGWIQNKLAAFTITVSTGPFGSLLHKSDYVSEGVPLVNPINIVNNSIIPNESKQINVTTKARLQSYVLKEGDIVIGRRGEIGRCAVVSEKQSGWICGTGCFFIRPLPTTNPHFLANLIRSGNYREKLEQASSGATMLNLSNKALCDLEIAMPSFEEQKNILQKIDALSKETQRLETLYQRKIALLDELKKSLLQQAFAGEL